MAVSENIHTDYLKHIGSVSARNLFVRSFLCTPAIVAYCRTQRIIVRNEKHQDHSKLGMLLKGFDTIRYERRRLLRLQILLWVHISNAGIR